MAEPLWRRIVSRGRQSAVTSHPAPLNLDVFALDYIVIYFSN
jgi:hypothetical protein